MAYSAPDFIKLFLILLLVLVLLSWHFYQVRFFFAFLGIMWSIPNVCWFLSKLYYRWSRKTYISPHKKAVLVTGCDSGLGHLTAKVLDHYGFCVFAGCLFPKGVGAQKLYTSSSKRLRILPLDVTKKEDIEAAIKEIKECDLELWAVVNNAGNVDYGSVELGDINARMKKILGVNFFGSVSVTKACLPLIRKSNGRIVFVTSVLSRLAMQFCSPYIASQYALRAFADALKLELAEFGIKTITIEPACYRTEMTTKENLINSFKENLQASDPEIKSIYNEVQMQVIESFDSLNKYVRNEVYEVPLAIEEAVTVLNPLGVYTCAGFFDKIALWFAYKLPSDLDIYMIANAAHWINLLFSWGK